MSDNLEVLKDRVKQQAELTKLRLYQDLSKRIGTGERVSATELKNFNMLDRYFNGDSEGNGGGPPEVFDNFDDAIEYLGVSRRTLSVNIKKGNIKQEPDGTFFKSELDKYLAKNGRKTEDQAVAPIEIQIKEADLRWRVAKATREETLNKQLDGTLISKDEVYTEWSAIVAAVMSSIEIFADRLPPLLYGRPREQMFEIIRDEVWMVRDMLYREGKYTPPPIEEKQCISTSKQKRSKKKLKKSATKPSKK